MSRWPWGKCVTVLVALLVTLGPSRVSAQSTASISGVVKDIGGAVLPGVSVSIKNDASGTAQEVLTDAMGRYQVTALEAGSYTVTAALTGFKAAEAKGVRVAPGQPITTPFTLEIASL
jgi:hypothetical protein